MGMTDRGPRLKLPQAVARPERPSPRDVRAHALATMAQDVRAPLQTLASFTELLLDPEDGLAPAQRVIVNRIGRLVERLGQMTEGLLSLYATAEHPLAPERVDLGSLARAAVHDASVALGGPSPAVSIQPELSVEGDPALLRIALQHLVEAAWRGCASVESPRLEIAEVELDGERCLYVRHNGPAPAALGAIFDYGRGRPPEEALGLHHVRRIVERHGGRAWATATPETGVTLWFTLGERALSRAGSA